MRRKSYWAKRGILTMLLLGLLVFTACGEEETRSSRRKKSEETEESEESRSSRKKKKDEGKDKDASAEGGEAATDAQGGDTEDVTDAQGSDAEDATGAQDGGAQAEPSDETPASEPAAEPEVDNELYAYYDLLDQAYREDQDQIKNWYSHYGFGIISRRGDRIYFPDGGSRYYYSYDLNTKELEEVSWVSRVSDNYMLYEDYYKTEFGKLRGSWYDKDGFFYLSYPAWDQNLCDGLCYYDYDGNGRKVLALDERVQATALLRLDEGLVLLGYGEDGILRVCYEDGRIVSIPPAKMERELGHGLTEEVVADYCGGIGTRLYCKVDETFYEFDFTNSTEWTECEVSTNLNGYYYHEGRYSYYEPDPGYAYWVTDIQNNERVIDLSDAYSGMGMIREIFYYGGKEHIVLSGDGNWYRVQIPYDGSGVDFSRYQPMGRETGSGGIMGIDDTYYIYTDKYGIFLRKYETGEDWEETILMFEQ